MNGIPLQGSVHAKTGTLSGVGAGPHPENGRISAQVGTGSPVRIRAGLSLRIPSAVRGATTKHLSFPSRPINIPSSKSTLSRTDNSSLSLILTTSSGVNTKRSKIEFIECSG